MSLAGSIAPEVDDAVRPCPHCGIILAYDPGRMFCPFCGLPLKEVQYHSSAPTVKCPYGIPDDLAGKSNTCLAHDNKFCEHLEKIGICSLRSSASR